MKSDKQLAVVAVFTASFCIKSKHLFLLIRIGMRFEDSFEANIFLNAVLDQNVAQVWIIHVRLIIIIIIKRR